MDMIIPDHMRDIMNKVRPHLLPGGEHNNRVYEAIEAWRREQLDELEIAIDAHYKLIEKGRDNETRKDISG
jgi:hypothetical protein